MPLFGLEKLTGAFLNVAVGIGALALGASFLRESFRKKEDKKEKGQK